MPEITVKLGDTEVQKYAFDKDVFTVGRGKDNDLVLETLSVSRNHIRIRREGNRYILSDLHSANGTYVNGVKVSKTEIMDGDAISIGKHKLIFALSPEAGPAGLFGADLDAQGTMIVDASPVAELTITRGKQQGQSFTVDRYETLLGRAAECAVRIHDWFVGKKHAAIYREGSVFTIRDLGKLAGVSVNETVVRGSCRLNDGDEIKIGPVQLRFRLISAAAHASAQGRQPVEILRDQAAAENAVAVENADAPIPFVSESAVSAPTAAAVAEPQVEEEGILVSAEDLAVEAREEVPAPSVALEVESADEEAAAAPPEPAAPVPAVDSANAKEIAMWEKALLNDSPAIRREAARRLKKLTGKDYEI